MIGRVRCWWHGEHDYERSDHIERYTLNVEDDEIAGHCQRCGDVVWVSGVFDE